MVAPTRDRQVRLVLLQDVCKRLAGRPVLRDLSLAIGPGEAVSLLGAAGAGKSTLLSLIAGTMAADSGRIEIDGRDVTRLKPHRRNIGVVPEDATLLPHLDVSANIAFPLVLRAAPRRARRARVAHLLDAVELTGLARARPAALSPAERQCAALARALAFEPKLLLLDAPFSACAPKLRERLLDGLRRLCAETGLSVLHATQDREEAAMFADRIAVMQLGAIVQEDAPGPLYRNPESAAVSRLTGEENRLRGRIAAVEDDIATVQLVCGPTVFARMADAGGVDEPCVVSIRPERIAVAAVDAAEMGEDAIAARLETASDRGDHIRLLLSVGTGGAVVVKRPAAAGMAGLSSGASVAIAWQPFHAHAFRPEV